MSNQAKQEEKIDEHFNNIYHFSKADGIHHAYREYRNAISSEVLQVLERLEKASRPHDGNDEFSDLIQAEKERYS